MPDPWTIVLVMWVAALGLAAGSAGAWTPLGLVNFVVLQWFGVRLQAEVNVFVVEVVVAGDTEQCELPQPRGRWWSRHAPRDGRVSWSLLRWVWPLTGWWSAYRWIARRS